MPDIWDQDTSPLTDQDRQKILARIHSLLYWLGKFVPEEELLDGKKIKLRDVIHNYVSKANPTPQDVEGAMSLASALEAKARVLEEELRTQNMSKGKAHIILDEICGLMRAVDDIRHAKSSDAYAKAVALMSKVKDERRWQEFIRKLQ
ncbi:MAG TPA: DUF5788 family protein [Methanomassiliicoccales archaeon]|nr:DUF5788 family protein [Methanomassiliicoccales archaeon]